MTDTRRTDTRRIESLERRLDELQLSLQAVAATQRAVHEDVEELFSEVGQALDVVAASLEDLVPEDERDGWSEHTGVMGRAFELQAIVRMFRGSLSDLHHRLRSSAARCSSSAR